MRRGEEPVAEAVEPARWRESAVEHDESREITVLAPEAIACPGPHAWPAREAETGMKKVVRVRVLGEVARHRSNHAEVIRACSRMWEEIADPQPALPVLLELPGRTEHVPVVVELRALHLHGEWLPVQLGESRLRIKGIDLGWSAGHEEADDPLGPGSEMRHTQAPSTFFPRPQQGSESYRCREAAASAKKTATGQFCPEFKSRRIREHHQPSEYVCGASRPNKEGSRIFRYLSECSRIDGDW